MDNERITLLEFRLEELQGKVNRLMQDNIELLYVGLQALYKGKPDVLIERIEVAIDEMKKAIK